MFAASIASLSLLAVTLFQSPAGGRGGTVKFGSDECLATLLTKHKKRPLGTDIEETRRQRHGRNGGRVCVKERNTRDASCRRIAIINSCDCKLAMGVIPSHPPGGTTVDVTRLNFMAQSR